MIETPETIWAWQKATFGTPDPRSPAVALRLLTEAVELCAACGATLEEMERSIYSRPEIGVYKRHPRPAKVPGEAADVYVVLCQVVGTYGFDLNAEVQRKMKTNRDRRWRSNCDGTGQHIRQVDESGNNG